MSNVVSYVDRFGFLKVRSERREDTHVVALAGEFDISEVARVSEALRCAEATDARRIVLDLSDLVFMDSSGVRMIVEAQARSRARAKRLVVTCQPGPVQRLFDLSDLAARAPLEA